MQQTSFINLSEAMGFNDLFNKLAQAGTIFFSFEHLPVDGDFSIQRLQFSYLLFNVLCKLKSLWKRHLL